MSSLSLLQQLCSQNKIILSRKKQTHWTVTTQKVLVLRKYFLILFICRRSKCGVRYRLLIRYKGDVLYLINKFSFNFRIPFKKTINIVLTCRIPDVEGHGDLGSTTWRDTVIWAWLFESRLMLTQD